MTAKSLRRCARCGSKRRRAPGPCSACAESDFQLTNTPPKRKPWRGKEPENTRQSLLLAGLDCLPGQQDLFSTDGQQEE